MLYNHRRHRAKCLNDLTTVTPVAPAPILTKCFKSLVLAHLGNLSTNQTRPPVQFAYRQSGSMEDAISKLDNHKNYVRMLLLDFSSALNSNIPTDLVTELLTWVCEVRAVDSQHPLEGREMVVEKKKSKNTLDKKIPCFSLS